MYSQNVICLGGGGYDGFEVDRQTYRSIDR